MGSRAVPGSLLVDLHIPGSRHLLEQYWRTSSYLTLSDREVVSLTHLCLIGQREAQIRKEPWKSLFVFHLGDPSLQQFLPRFPDLEAQTELTVVWLAPSRHLVPRYSPFN